MKKVVAMLLTAVLAISCLSACGSNGGSKSTVIKIGGQGPLTGGAAIYGLACQRAAEIAVDEINEKAGKTVFELKYEDDQHDVSVAANAYNALTDWGMQVYLGCVTSGPSLVTAPMAANDNIFFLTPSGSNADIVKAGKNVFQMCFADPNQGSASAQYIKNKELGSKIAVIYQSDIDYSMGIYDTFMEKANELGLSVVSESSFVTDAVDFSVQIAAAKDAGADVLYLPIYYQEASLILAQCSNAGYAPVMFGVDGMDGILTMEGFDTALAEDVMLLTPFSADAPDEKTKSFVAKYQEKYGETPNQFAADTYDCVYAIYQAVQAGKITADMSTSDICDKLVEQFNSMTFDGITGTGMTWSEDGYVTKDPKGMIIKDGVYVGLD